MSLAVPGPAPAPASDQLPLEALDTAPAQVVLRPGVRVVRRDERHRQVGLDDLAVVVPDHPATDRALAELAAGRPVALDDLEPRLRGRLGERGLLVDPRAVAAPGVPTGGPRETVAAAYAAHGPEAARRLAARRARTVVVAGPPGWDEDTRRLLTLAGLTVRAAAGREPRRPVPGRSTALLVLSAGEPRRSDLDAAVQRGRPHLVVASVQGRFRVGPFVVPGVTACLRCVDAHLSEQDPRRSLVVEQQAPGDEPVDPALGALASALAVRDLVAWAEGGRPSTWSATVTLDPRAAHPTDDLLPRPWAIHPCCGCGWGNRLPVD